MKTRIRRTNEYLLGRSTYVPEYKSAWYMPWRRITSKDGSKPYSTGNYECLIPYCEAVMNGRKPRMPKPNKVVWKKP